MIFTGLTILAVVSAGLIYLLQFRKVKIDQPILADYEMVRPQDSGSLYSISGRQVQRNILQNEPSQTGGVQVIKPFNPLLAPTENVAKTKQKRAVIPNPTSVSPASPGGEARVVDTDIQNTLAAGESPTDAANSVEVLDGTQAIYSANKVAAPATEAAINADGTTKNDPEVNTDKKKVTFQDLRDQLLQTLSPQAEAQLIEAYVKAEVQDAEYFGLAFEMIQSGRKDQRTVGLDLLIKTNAPKAFENIVKGYAGIKDTELRQLVWNVVLQFSESQRSFQLLSGLNSKDLAIQKIAVQVVTYKIRTLTSLVAKSTSPTVIASGKRELASIQTFIPTLKEITKSSDPSVAALAGQMNFEIQNLSARFDRVATTE